MILAKYYQQPGEVRSRSVSFKRFLDAAGETASPENPYQVLATPGLTVIADAWVDSGGYYKALLSGVAGKHKLTVWLNTSGGQRLEADIIIYVKET